MNQQTLIEQFLNIRTWIGDGGRAPHKPLLLLYALGQLAKGETKFPFVEIDRTVKQLLQDFGPSRNSCHPEYPFWRLQNDHNLWEVRTSKAIRPNKSGDVSRKKLIAANAHGQFSKPVTKILVSDQQFLGNLITSLLDHNFPETIHEDILQSIGFDLNNSTEMRKKRCPKFREKVLQAYDYRCAICGFDVRIGHFPVALEAAHIKWHVAGGPDSEENGLALCSLHHKLFDRGAFTISKKNIMLVSDKANGTDSFDLWLMKYHGKKINSPQRVTYQPDLNFVSWHINEVFQGKYLDYSNL